MNARVALVGAGPGDPGLLTARALDLISRADAIYYDRLIPSSALDGARSDAELIYVGKRPGAPSMPQEEINAALVARAKRGGLIVRLKGGDPFVFGRGGEEALELRAAGIDFEVVPAVTAGIAATAYAGIPVTHRDRASAVAFVTGHEDPSKPESAIDWTALAAFPGTLVFYMGVKQLGRIAEQLIGAGRPADQPAAVVERGTHPDQRTITATLAAIAEAAIAADIKPPSITVVGEVVGLRDDLAWLEKRPLHGRSVAVTRARAQASGLAHKLRELGATVIETPTIRVTALPGDAPDLTSYDLVCLTSPNGVSCLFERLNAAGLDARALATATVAAIGPGTARALSEHGITADLIPATFVAEGLIEALRDTPVKRALIATALDARDVLPEALRQRGADVDVLALYETVAEPLDDQTLAAARAADYITFTSSSTVTFFLAAAGEAGLSHDTRVVSIGPVTTATLREHSIAPAVEAQQYDIDGLIAAIVADATE
ncbi:MAG: uroporphyrinogen-III C-methyltransferase [Actinomycetota bacterium]